MTNRPDSARGKVNTALVVPVMVLVAALLMLGAMALFSGGAGGTSASSASTADPALIERGRASFEAGASLQGTIAGQTLALPTTALRCINCHTARTGAEPDRIGGVTGDGIGDGNGDQRADQRADRRANQRGSDVARPASASFGPPLGGTNLTASKSRRRGPASSFDERTFCRLLRTGVDPAHIVIAQSMPRYRLSDEACAELWAYLLRAGT